MNPLFLPNEHESNLIQIIQKYWRDDFALIRMTGTMINKGIIDASEEIRLLLRSGNIADYKNIAQGGKILRQTVVVSPQGIFETTTSLYRPVTKKGDPRFWVYKFNSHVTESVLVYFTIHDSKIVAIPLIEYERFTENIVDYFGVNDEEKKIIEEFINRIRAIRENGWVISVSPDKLNDKDIGETLERELGVKINNLKTPDFEGVIEVKGKNLSAKTKDSLFSMVPDWGGSSVKSVNELALKYGYPDNEYDGYKALFVTVSNRPNKQGLFLEVDEENERILQKCMVDGIITDVCSWNFADVKERLYNKHPKTMWIVADNKKIDGGIHFKYLKVQFTQRPIFSQFITLLQQGIITFDWRRRANDGSTIKLPASKMDYGHGFRIDPSKRHLLFGETTDLEL